MVPFLYLAIKSLYWSKGKTLKKIMWCDDDNIKPYFIEAGRKITYGNLRRQLLDSLEDRPFPELPDEFQKIYSGSLAVKKITLSIEMQLCRLINMEIFRFLRAITICSIRFLIQKDLRRCWNRSLRRINSRS